MERSEFRTERRWALRKGRCWSAMKAPTQISSRLSELTARTEAITRTVSSCNSPGADYHTTQPQSAWRSTAA